MRCEIIVETLPKIDIIGVFFRLPRGKKYLANTYT